MSNEWVKLTSENINSIDNVVWLATTWGEVVQGCYEWQQGHNPEGFNTEGEGRISARDVIAYMECIVPKHPGKM